MQACIGRRGGFQGRDEQCCEGKREASDDSTSGYRQHAGSSGLGTILLPLDAGRKGDKFNVLQFTGREISVRYGSWNNGNKWRISTHPALFLPRHRQVSGN